MNANNSSRVTYGRTVIYSDYEQIDLTNVQDMLAKTFPIHIENANDITYLWHYYLGCQPIINKTRELKPESNAIVIENRANEIVSFKVGYLIGEPIQYVSRSSDERVIEDINRLNSFLIDNDKACLDEDLATWFTVCGTSYRMVLPNRAGFPPFSRSGANDGSGDIVSPFNVFTLDPRFAYVVYYSGLGNRPLCGVQYIVKQDGSVVFSVYTDTLYIELTSPSTLGTIVQAGNVVSMSVEDTTITKYSAHTIGYVPIIEYPNNSARLGAFEPVLTLLDAINEVASDRIDAVNDFVNALLVLKGVDLDDEDMKRLIQLGGIQVPADGDVKYIVNNFNQNETQSLIDHMYQAVLTIVGLPNRNGGTSTSDTGQAVYLRDGFSSAETRAVSSENIFKRSEKAALRIMLKCCNTSADTNLNISDVEIRFTRRNYENIMGKAQVLIEMLSTDKIHPKLAFSHCGMFSDPNLAYTESEKYYKEREKEFLNEQKLITEDSADEDEAVGGRREEAEE